MAQSSIRFCGIVGFASGNSTATRANRSKAGFITSGEYQSEEDPNKITIIGEAPSVEAIQNFMSNPALKAAMEKGGVIGMPEVHILNKMS